MAPAERKVAYVLQTRLFVLGVLATAIAGAAPMVGLVHALLVREADAAHPYLLAGGALLALAHRPRIESAARRLAAEES
jgi:hypothetical protein